MKRKILLLICVLTALSPLTARGQTGLNINRLFTDSFRGQKGVTETVLNRERLKSKYQLSLYHSLTITGHPELAAEIEPLLAADGAKAKNKEVRYKSVRLYYGLYRLNNTAAGKSRYILYLNGHLNGDNKIILLYLEGNVTLEEVKKMLNK
ncbi:MAG: hypothetical protein K2G01_06460 [Paramuribaculum sp.]|nr:hypothetical protein [Paramuribaculum sp.]